MRRPLGLVAIGLGTQARSAAPPSLSGLQTLTVITKTREAMVVDLGPPGPSQGDLRVVNAPLYDRTGTNAIGWLDLFCVVTDPADKPGETTHLLVCSGTYTLPKGTLTTHDLTPFSTLPETPLETVVAAPPRSSTRSPTRPAKPGSTLQSEYSLWWRKPEEGDRGSRR
jgi:hypothetical protein